MNAEYLIGQWLPCCGNILLQSLFVLCIALSALTLARRAPASMRHLIAVSGQIVLMMLPFAAIILPGRATIPGRQAATAVTLPGRVASSLLALARPDGGVKNTSTPRNVRDSSVPITASGQTFRGRDTQPPVLSGTTSFLTYKNPVYKNLGLCAFMVWLAGAAGLLMRFGIGAVRLRQLAQECETISNASLLTLLYGLQAKAGLRRRIKMVQTLALKDLSGTAPAITVAMTWGARRPVLLLPSDAAQWEVGRLQAVALHELAHIRRYDWLTQTLGQIVSMIYWFNPLVWRLHQNAQIEAEHACDDTVLRSGVRGSEYAAHLLNVVRAMQAGRAPLCAAVSMARVSQVQPRVEAILCPRCRRGEVRRPLLAASLVTAVLVFFAANRLRPFLLPAIPNRAMARVRSTVSIASKAKAPLLPRAAQTAVAPGLPAYRRTFSCGLTLELTAVAEARTTGERWWQPDGGALPEGLESSGELGAVKTWEAKDNGRAFLFRSSGTLDHDYSTATQVSPVKLWPGVQHFVYKMRYPVQTLNRGFPAGARQCKIRYGVAAGAWKTVGVVRMPSGVRHIKSKPKVLQSDIDIFLYSKSYLGYEDLAGKYHSLHFLPYGKLSDNVARRIVAVDGNGTLLPLDWPSASGWYDEYYGLNFQERNSGIDLAHIHEFRLQTRPYEWVEFPNVQLQPAQAGTL